VRALPPREEVRRTAAGVPTWRSSEPATGGGEAGGGQERTLEIAFCSSSTKVSNQSLPHSSLVSTACRSDKKLNEGKKVSLASIN
jgi:hypothetical protein